MAQLDPINALADAAPGFVWRLQTADGNAMAVRGFDSDRMIVNLSVWESVDQLADFVYRSGHVAVMRRRREWFERVVIHMALWWVPIGRVSSVAEAEKRLAYLQLHGPTRHAFTFKTRFLVGGEALLTPDTVAGQRFDGDRDPSPDRRGELVAPALIPEPHRRSPAADAIARFLQ